MQTSTPPPPPAITAVAPATTRGRFTLPSELPTGDVDEDTIAVDYYPTDVANAPAVIVLPPIGTHEGDRTMRRIAEFAASHGVNAAVVTLPYHGTRWPKAEGGRPNPALHFLSGDAARSAQAFEQSASDAMTVVDWLVKQPNVDSRRIGVVGISLGAIVAHLAMGRDNRITAGVTLLGGGDLPDISRHSEATFLVRLFHPAQRAGDGLSDSESDRLLRRADPLTYADGNRPRNVLMVEAARDFVIPPKDATELWEALGRPPIRWIDCNHFALRLAPSSAMEPALGYFKAVWGAPTPEAAVHVPVPAMSVPTIKIGLLDQLHGPDSLGLTPDATFQLGSIGSYSNHISIVHGDFGVSTRGPFAAAALTLGTYADLGFASRISPRTEAPRPYLGLHLTF